MALPLDVGHGPAEVAAFTGLMLGAGYTLSAASPFLLGAIRDATNGYDAVLWVLAGVAVALLAIDMSLTSAPACRGIDPQYVARPPEMSKHAPVEKLISSLASQQIERRDLGRLADPRERDARGHVVDVLLGDLPEHRRVDHRRRDAVHEDPAARDVLADRLRQRRSPRAFDEE